jgi:hypothetical protein
MRRDAMCCDAMMWRGVLCGDGRHTGWEPSRKRVAGVDASIPGVAVVCRRGRGRGVNRCRSQER